MLSSCGDGLLGADGAAGRESTIWDAETTGFAGGVGVVAGRDAEAVKTMQETLQELQTLRTEYEDIRRRLDALKGEESVGSAAFSSRRCCVAVLPMAFGSEADS